MINVYLCRTDEKEQSKENKAIYVRVEKLNFDEEYEKYRYLVGQELTLSELEKLMEEAE